MDDQASRLVHPGKGKVAGPQAPLQALALKWNRLQFNIEYKEELHEKNDHLQAELRKELGDKLEAFMGDIVAQAHAADVMIRLEACASQNKITRLQSALRVAMDSRARVSGIITTWNLVEDLSRGLEGSETIKVGIDAIDNAKIKLSLPFNDFHEKVQAQQNQNASPKDSGTGVNPTHPYSIGGREDILIPVFDDPTCKREDRVKARRADLGVYFDNLTKMSDAQFEREKEHVDEHMDEAVADICREEKRFKILGYVQAKGSRTADIGDIELRCNAVKEFDVLMLQLKLTMLELAEPQILNGHDSSQKTLEDLAKNQEPESAAADTYEDNSWMAEAF